MLRPVHTLLAHYNFFGGWPRAWLRHVVAAGGFAALEPPADLPASAWRLADKQMAILKALNIRVLPYWQFPSWLGASLQPPALLFIRGRLDLVYKRGWAVVGSRRAQDKARAWASRFAKTQSEAGHLIISGGACGIDGAAHQGALAACGPTLAWLGVAADRIYPVVHRQLFATILAQGGALVSEIPPLAKSWPSDHARRNRFIAGQASNLMIVSAGLRSGSLGTARWAEKIGQRVWVPTTYLGGAREGIDLLLRHERAHMWCFDG